MLYECMLLFQNAFKNCREGVFLHTRSDGKFLNKVTKVLIRMMLFADAAVVSHTEEGLQQPLPRLQGIWPENQPERGRM